MNIDSFTEEQLLSMVNRTILQETKYSLDDYSGGYVSVTTAYRNKLTKYRVALFFGYKNDGKTSLAKVIEIDESLYFLWSKAIMLKTLSMKINTIRSTLNDVNKLIKPVTEEEQQEIKNRSEKKDRADTERKLPLTLVPITKIPPTSIPPKDDSVCDVLIKSFSIKTFLDMKDFLIMNRKDKHGNQLQFLFEDKFVSISDTKLLYYRASQKNLDFRESDRFYKTMLTNLPQIIELIEESMA